MPGKWDAPERDFRQLCCVALGRGCFPLLPTRRQDERTRDDAGARRKPERFSFFCVNATKKAVAVHAVVKLPGYRLSPLAGM